MMTRRGELRFLSSPFILATGSIRYIGITVKARTGLPPVTL